MTTETLFRQLPPFKGKIRLAKLLFSKSISSKKDVLIRGKYDCKYLLPNLTENVSLDIFTNGIYEQHTSDFFIQNIPQDGVFLDLGANIGAITIPLLKNRTDIKMICVEASPWIFEYLQKNIKLNNVESSILINKALYHTDGKKLKFYSPIDKFGKGSLSPVFTNNAETVTTITIDSIITELNLQRVDFIKIDVEGYEYHAFKGAIKLFSEKNAPGIVFEFVDWAEKHAGLQPGDAQRLLRELGYIIYRLDDAGELSKQSGILTKGSAMLLAAKKQSF